MRVREVVNGLFTRNHSGVDMSGPQPDRVIRARGDIAIWERGIGPTVVCIHGFPDHAVGMLPLAESIARSGFRALCIALPGYYPSGPAPNGEYGIPAVSADVITVLDTLGIQQASIVGHDWGAGLGYFLAARFPERLSCLVALSVPHGAGFSARRRVYGELRTAWYAHFLAYSPHAAVAAVERTWLTALAQDWSPGFHRVEWPDILDFLCRREVIEAVCRYYYLDLSGDLQPEQVLVPTTVIHGGQDGCIRPALFEGLEEWFASMLARHLIVDAGHWPHLESPERVSRIIVETLRTNAA